MKRRRANPDPANRARLDSLSIARWFDGMTCSICGTRIHMWQRFNWDHEIPVSKGGRRGRLNRRIAHCLCNSVKGDRYPFSLRTKAEREAFKAHVLPRTYRRLQRIWNGEPG